MATATAIPSTPPSLSTTTTKGKMHYNKKSIGDEKIHKGVFDMIRLYGLIIISSCLVIQDYLLLVVKHKNWILNKQERTNFTNTIKNTIRRYVLSVIYTISSNIIHIFVIIPFNIWYYIIITIPYLIIYNIYLFFIKLIKVLCRKSSTLCILVSRVTALLDVIISIHKKICSSNIIELVSLGVEGIQEV